MYWACYGLYAFDAASGAPVFTASIGGDNAFSMAVDDAGVVMLVAQGADAVVVRSHAPLAAAGVEAAIFRGLWACPVCVDRWPSMARRGTGCGRPWPCPATALSESLPATALCA